MQDSIESKEKKGRAPSVKVPQPESEECRLRLNLVVPHNHPLAWMQLELKSRGLKNIELGDLILEALKELPESYWLEKRDSLTPLEFRIQAALSNPEMRAKLAELLS